MITPTIDPTCEDIAEHYDSLGVFYRDTWGDHLHHGYWETGQESAEQALDNLTATVFRFAHISQGDTVVDIGSGYGATSLCIAERFDAKVTGYTLSRTQCTEAQERSNLLPVHTPSPIFHCLDWMKNELPDASVDSIISIECLSHIPDKAKFFKEVARVLKPGGHLGLSDWLAKEGPKDWEKGWLLEPICHEGRLAGLCDGAELQGLAKAAGLRVSKFNEIGPHVRKTWRIITARLIGKLFTQREYRAFLVRNLKSDRIFALTIARMIAAYATGSLGYGLLSVEKARCD